MLKSARPFCSIALFSSLPKIFKAESMNSNKTNLISQYIKAKDNNKPHLMKHVFAEQAKVAGLDKITQTLVCEFNTTYENIYTLCLTDTLQQTQNRLSCRWVVCMTDKTSQSLRIGYGNYQWDFKNDTSALVHHLTITIENMSFLPQSHQSDVLTWFDKQPYPWALSSELQTTMPDNKLLSDTLMPLYR